MRGKAPQAVAAGEYSRKQLRGGGLMEWSHRRRFARAVRLARPYAGRSLLDYGCGDGTLLAFLAEDFPRAVGAEIDPRLARDCAERFRHLSNVTFVVTDELTALPDGSFGLIICTEVMEHCTTENLDAAIATMARLLAPDGALVVSVPVEVGPPLIIKQLARTLKSMRRQEITYRDRERYSPGEFLTMLVAAEDTAIDRPEYRQDFAPDRPNAFHGHKGFNWRALRRRLSRTFVIERTSFSPVAALGALGASQAWFVCRPR